MHSEVNNQLSPSLLYEDFNKLFHKWKRKVSILTSRKPAISQVDKDEVAQLYDELESITFLMLDELDPLGVCFDCILWKMKRIKMSGTR